MNTIEITTAQKVIIQYELASLGNRFVAFFIDMMILFGGMILLNIIALQIFYDDWGGYQYYLYLIVLPYFLFYTLVSEILLDGQTIGKRSIGLKVVKLNGDPAAPFDYVMRWAFRFIDIWFSFGAVAAMLVSASPSAQRLGGVLSGTTVIRKNSTRNFSLKDILSISTRADYEPQYPEVVKMSEQDMLFVKRVLDRIKKYKNQAHRDVVKQLALHMAEKLEIKTEKIRPQEFLRTLLTDYIVLTR
jgi:uncharacterized RDD family membrane protein YckC